MKRCLESVNHSGDLQIIAGDDTPVQETAAAAAGLAHFYPINPWDPSLGILTLGLLTRTGEVPGEVCGRMPRERI